MRLNRLNQLIDKEGRLLDGSWRLTRRHRLEYRRRGGQEEILLAGELDEARPTGLGFRFLERRSDGEAVVRQAALRGRWQADEKNRLSFLLEGQKDRQESLTLQGGWELGPGQEIVYRVERTKQKRGTKESRLLRFQGRWEISDDRRLVYVLNRASDSAFRFRGAFQTGSVLAREGKIRYQLGAEVEEKPRSKTLTLFGKWKLSRRLGLSFEIPTSDGAARGIGFEADYSLDSRGRISALLMTRRGEPLGLEVLFSRDLAGLDGELFLRLRKRLEETAVEGGVRFQW